MCRRRVAHEIVAQPRQITQQGMGEDVFVGAAVEQQRLHVGALAKPGRAERREEDERFDRGGLVDVDTVLQQQLDHGPAPAKDGQLEQCRRVRL